MLLIPLNHVARIIDIIFYYHWIALVVDNLIATEEYLRIATNLNHHTYGNYYCDAITPTDSFNRAANISVTSFGQVFVPQKYRFKENLCNKIQTKLFHSLINSFINSLIRWFLHLLIH